MVVLAKLCALLPPELEEAAAIARGFEGKADGKTPRAVDAKEGEA